MRVTCTTNGAFGAAVVVAAGQPFDLATPLAGPLGTIHLQQVSPSTGYRLARAQHSPPFPFFGQSLFHQSRSRSLSRSFLFRLVNDEKTGFMRVTDATSSQVGTMPPAVEDISRLAPRLA